MTRPALSPHSWLMQEELQILCRYCNLQVQFFRGYSFPYCVVNWNLIQSIRLFYSHVIVSQLYNTVLYSIHYLTHMVRLRLCCILNGGKKEQTKKAKEEGLYERPRPSVASQKWNKKRILLTCCSILDKRTPLKNHKAFWKIHIFKNGPHLNQFLLHRWKLKLCSNGKLLK